MQKTEIRFKSAKLFCANELSSPIYKGSLLFKKKLYYLANATKNILVMKFYFSLINVSIVSASFAAITTFTTQGAF